MDSTEINYQFLRSISTDTFNNITPSLPSSSWKADWLLNEFASNRWEVKTADSVKLKSGKWSNTAKIYFTDTLPNGQKLSDDSYKDIRETLKKILYLSRQGYLLGVEVRGGETTRSKQLQSLCNSLKMVIKWMINNGHKPELTGFRSLSSSDIYDFSKDCLGGAQQADGTVDTIRTFLTDARHQGKLTNYLKDGRLDIRKITSKLELIDNDGRALSLSYYSLSALNSFETKPLPQWLFSTRSNKTEYLAATAQRFRDAIQQPPSKSLLSGYLKGFKAIGYFSTLLSELKGLDWASDFSPEEIGTKLGFSDKGKTRTIPIKTALEYLDNAIFWIVEIAPSLITLKEDCDNQLLEILSSNNSRKDQVVHRVELDIPKSLSDSLATKGLALTRYNQNPTKTPYAEVRENLSVEEAVECVVAAAYILIGTFSCKRISEVLSLTRNCDRPALDGGTELVFGLRKASPSEALSLIGRPVPDLVRKTVDVLNDLRPPNTLSQTETPEHDPLFLSSYNTNRSNRAANQMSSDTLYRLLEKFADIVQITPTDNRRWYIRTHELRRFFAITYFWHDRFSNLPALTWFMGHTDPNMTMRYVTEVISGLELPEEEARFIVQSMKDNRNITNIDNLGSLLSMAAIKFDTDDLSIIDQHRLENYFKELFSKGYAINKHQLGTEIIYFEETLNV